MIFEQKLYWSVDDRDRLIERARKHFEEMVSSGELFMLVTPDKNYFCIKHPMLDYETHNILLGGHDGQA